MKLKNILRNVPKVENLELDMILFESQYPVLFTCRTEKDVFLFLCCLVNAEKMQWIATKTDYETLIALLSDEITIRDAFLQVSDEKMIIEYDGICTNSFFVNKDKIPSALLPTAGEYMEAEENEYAEEIAVFRKRSSRLEIKFTLPIFKVQSFTYKQNNIHLPEEFFSIDDKRNKRFAKSRKDTFAWG